MKKHLIIILTLILTFNLYAQEKPVKIVFDVTSDNEKVHQSTVRHVKMMSEAYPDSQFEVVMYSASVDMVQKDKSIVAEEMENLAKKENVSFIVCAMTLKKHNVSVDKLVPGVEQVPDGILEIITKQQQGWGYIKEGQ